MTESTIPNSSESDFTSQIIAAPDEFGSSIPIATTNNSSSDPTAKTKKNHIFSSNLFWIIFPFISVILVLYYILFLSKSEFHSDCTDTLFWAEAAMQGKGLINPDFNYAALMPLGGNLLMQIWIPFFGVSMTTHILGMTTFFLLFVGFLCLMLRELHFGLPSLSITVSGLLLTLCLSEKLREIFWNHIIYYSLGILFLFIGLFLVFRIQNLSEQVQNRKIKLQTALFFLLFFLDFLLCCTNSTTAIALFALPILGSLFLERFLDSTTKWTDYRNQITILILLTGAIGLFFGLLLGNILDGSVTAKYAEAYSKFSDPSKWWSHVEKFPLAYLQLLGLTVSKTDDLASLTGVHTILIIFYALFLLIVPMVALFCYQKIQDRGVRTLIWVHIIISTFILVGYFCGLLSAGNWRLSPMICTSVLVSFSFLRWLYQQAGGKCWSILFFIPITYLCTYSAVNVSQISINKCKESVNYRLGEYLQKQQLTYGYASFWHSQVITVLEDSKVKVRTIEISEEDGLSASLYQSNITWFEDQPGQDRYFLLMEAEEKSQLEQSGDAVLDLSHEEQTYLGYTIWIFTENPLSKK